MHRTLFCLVTAVLLVAVATPAWSQRDRRDTSRDQTTKSTDRQTSSDFAAAERRKGTAAAKVAAELRARYRVPVEKMGALLNGAGYGAPQVMVALIAEGFSLSEAADDVGRYGGGPPNVGSGVGEHEQMARSLADGGHSAEEVAEVLVAVYDADADMVAEALHYAEYSASQAARALRIQFGADEHVAVASLVAADYSCGDAYTGVADGHGGFSGTATDRIAALYAAGCSQSAVQAVLMDRFTKGYLASLLAQALAP